MISKNIVANYVSNIWSVLMGFAFVPIYIRYLGTEAYGMIGVFAVLQTWFVLLDMGLANSLSRELATSGNADSDAIRLRNTFFSIEVVYVALAGLILAATFFSATALVDHWLKIERLPVDEATNALRIMGAVIAVRWLSGLYRSALVGLEAHILLGGIVIVFSTVRGVGVIVALILVSPSLETYFVFQLAASFIEAITLGISARRKLPTSRFNAVFGWENLKRIYRYSAGMAVTTSIGILVTQVDKLLLSGIIPLAEFGYFVLAVGIATSLKIFSTPLTTVAFPQFCKEIRAEDNEKLRRTYHFFSELMIVVMAPVSVMVVLFSDELLLLWSGNPTLVHGVSPILQLWVLGGLFGCFVQLPYRLVLAYGDSSFGARLNVWFAIIYTPLLLVLVSLYGAIAAGYLWSILNFAYLLVIPWLVHRRFMEKDFLPWMRQLALISSVSIVPLFFAWSVIRIAPLASPLLLVMMISFAYFLSLFLSIRVSSLWDVLIRPDRRLLVW